MINASYSIEGGNYEQAGMASSSLKNRLKRIGVEPETLRRIMIAAYEAEMNVVVHAHIGDMNIILNDRRVDIEVADEGPGIPDIDMAMGEGFSTAPPAARELGFGAGLGLPNIKKNSDLFAITSEEGSGTCLKFTIYLDAQKFSGALRNSLHIDSELCCECLRCLHSCPTKAIRVRPGGPQILDHLCIDCTACIDVCKTGALTVKCEDLSEIAVEDRALVISPPFLVQYGAESDPREVLNALDKAGFHDVIITAGWENALKKAVAVYARDEAGLTPVISPVCLAVVNFIEMRFPSLIANLAPFLSPIEALICENKLHHAVIAVACPCRLTVLKARRSSAAIKAVAPATLFNRVQPLINIKAQGSNSCQSPAPAVNEPGVLQASGIQHVVNLLEKAENGLLQDVSVLELFACDQGCFGSPMFKEDPFIARRRWLNAELQPDPSAKAVRRSDPFSARKGLRLDGDMAMAISKLSRIDELARSLPGNDCGMCGAPTCSALAEDLVLGRTEKEACVHLAGDRSKEK